ncbi:UDP-glycosyltransferase 73D1-like [Spinacia oleracea]|uniref:Glycosyltransferase n=1 Tax=Spinacia oleracea TaxID=3562 RepID=A0A9R0JW99_SPIOL|nr:UDP-glycosyltransferase 73D1-like [Spinacia oleracea]
MDSNTNQLHFILIPLLAQGHMIPMTDIAFLLAKQGMVVTLVMTPLNASRNAARIQRAADSGLQIRILEIPFVCQKVGLPEGCENLDIIPSRDMIKNFYKAMDEMQIPLEENLQRLSTPASCIISDKCLSWTSKTAEKFKIPRVVFHGMNCFSLLASHNIKLHNTHLSVSSSSQPFLVPGMPYRIQITKAQLPGSFVALPDLEDIRDQMREAESRAFGVIVNSFSDLEHQCIQDYQKAINKRVWCIGSVSLCNKEVKDKFERGNNASISENECLEWLNTVKPKSVIYVCLGSQCRLVPSQLIELGLGLEASNRPFVWAIKTGEKREELENWLVQSKFEDRIQGRGLLIKGWAPQVLILSHPSIKGFLTHCGWNSTIESISNGIPMITWPQFAEQFLNEKQVVDILQIGVRVGVDIPVRFGDEEKTGVLVNRHDIATAVNILMDGGEEGEKRRKRAKRLEEMARKAVIEGGSSNNDLSLLIQEIKEHSILSIV